MNVKDYMKFMVINSMNYTQNMKKVDKEEKQSKLDNYGMK